MESYTKEEIIYCLLYLYLITLVLSCYYYLRNMYLKYKLSKDKWHTIVDVDDQLHSR